MSGIIRWLAPHMFPQLNQQTPTAPTGPNPVDASANAAGNWAFSGVPGSPTGQQSLESLPPGQAPTSFQHALQNAWQRYAGQGQPMNVKPQPQVSMTPTPGQSQPRALPPLSAPPHDMHPSSIRVDFHPPPEPPDPLSFVHPGMGGAGQPLSQPSLANPSLPWPAGSGQ
jgi:hypothetical protein